MTFFDQRIYDAVIKYLIKDGMTDSIAVVWDIIQTYGPPVSHYPTWHPLVARYAQRSQRSDPTGRPEDCDYEGLDHTVYFANAFITCPYSDGKSVIDSVDDFMSKCSVADISARKLNVPMYHKDTTPILVSCDWYYSLNHDGTVPLDIAMPMMLKMEVKTRRDAKVSEKWQTMAPYLLGSPHTTIASAFINSESGVAMMNTWESLVRSGMFDNNQQ